jgi:hypothetical protein
MFRQTYGFSANFTVEFSIEQMRYKNPLIILAIRTTEDALAELGWFYRTDPEKNAIVAQAERVKESKVDWFCRTYVNRLLLPSDHSFAMAVTSDSISWQFQEAGSHVTANAEFFIRKTTFLNKPEQERLSSIVHRLFEQVARFAKVHSLEVTFTRK